MNDLISRKWLMECVNEGWIKFDTEKDKNIYVHLVRDIAPSAQPEIIHCKECKYGVQDEDKRWYCRGLGCQVGEADGSGFCTDAERRTDE